MQAGPLRLFQATEQIGTNSMTYDKDKITLYFLIFFGKQSTRAASLGFFSFNEFFLWLSKLRESPS